MNKKTFDQALLVALAGTRQAGQELKKLYYRPQRAKYTHKAKHQVVTAADKLAEKLILKRIRRTFPDHDILSEEAGSFDSTSKDYLWVVDPLDGTTNFTMKNPLFSTTVALVFKEQVVLGVIYAPVLNELYVTIRGQGATYNGKKMKVSEISETKAGFHTYCYGTKQVSSPSLAISYYRRMFMSGHEIRQLGAATLEFARVARGITESVVIPGANAWDVAAGALLVREAGGRVTDFNDQAWDIKSKDILATNGRLHGKLLKYLK